jgi:hypothetical protein
VSKNLVRRRPNESQRAAVAAKLATLAAGRPPKASIEALSQAEAAELLNAVT